MKPENEITFNFSLSCIQLLYWTSVEACNKHFHLNSSQKRMLFQSVDMDRIVKGYKKQTKCGILEKAFNGIVLFQVAGQLPKIV